MGVRTVLSDHVRRAAKLDPRPLYRLALEAGIPPGEIFKTESYGTDGEEG